MTNTEYDPCETCGYVEGSPFCLQYCPYDASRNDKKESCTDMINRNAVIRMSKNIIVNGNVQVMINAEDVLNLPSVNPRNHI